METKKQSLKIVLIGAGNVATHLANRMQKKGHYILQIVSRSQKNAQQLALQVHAPFTIDLKKINTQADIYIICTTDDAIEKIALSLKLPNKLVLHTSGSVGIDVLKNISTNVGVLYPLQSFSKQVKTSFSSVPLLIEGNNKASLLKIKQFASSLSKQVVVVNSSNRLKLHLAATLVNNFSNYLHGLSEDFLAKEKVNQFQLLLPLIKQTTNKIKTHKPFDVQTGPARRGDIKTINKHLALLQKYPNQKKIYQLFTELIKKQYHD